MRNSAFRKALADSYIPGELQQRLLNWVEHAACAAEDKFLQGLITNDLTKTLNGASEAEAVRIYGIVSILRRSAPPGAFFSQSAIWNWVLFINAEERAEDQAARFEAQQILNDLAEAQLQEIIHGA